MSLIRFLFLFGLLKSRKPRPNDPEGLLVDGDGAVLVDEDGNQLIG